MNYVFLKIQVGGHALFDIAVIKTEYCLYCNCGIKTLMRANEWHLRDPEAAASNLNTNLYNGLTSKEALKRQRKNGKNNIWHVERASATKYALKTIGDLTTVLLIITALIAAVFENSRFASVICIILVLGIVLRVATYIKAKRILEIMADEGIPNAAVLRDSKIKLIRADEIVIGDIIILGEGDVVPCDGRIISGEQLRVSEKGITGNKTSVIKRDTIIITDADGTEIPCEYRVNMLFAGSVILSGSCRIVVTACAEETLVCMKQGGIIVPSGEKLPIIENFSSWCRMGNLIMLALVIAVSGVTLVLNGTANLTDTFFNMTALAVSSTSGYLNAVGYIIIAVPVRRAAVGENRKNKRGRAVIKDCSCIEKIADVKRIVASDSSIFKSGNVFCSSFYYKGKVYKAGEGEPDELIGLALAAVCELDSDFGLYNESENTISSKKILIKKIAKSASEIYQRKMQYELSILDHAFTNDDIEGALDTVILYRKGSLEVFVSGDLCDVLRICDTYKKNNNVLILSEEEKQNILNLAAEIQNKGGSIIAVAGRVSPYTSIKRISYLHSQMCFEGFIASFEEPADGIEHVMESVKSSDISLTVLSSQPEVERGYLVRYGILSNQTQIIPYKDFLNLDIFSDGDFMIKVPSYDDTSLRKIEISDIRCSICGKIMQFDNDVAVVTKEALDSRMMNGSSVGVAVSRSDKRTIPQTLKRRSKVTAYPSSKSEFGGFAETIKAICESFCTLRNLQNVSLYVISSQVSRIVCALASAFFGNKIINASAVLLLGLLYDFFAVLVMAFKQTQNSDMKERSFKLMPSGKSIFYSAVLGFIWGALCSIIPLAEKVGNNPAGSGGTYSAVMVSMILCQFVVSSAYIMSGKTLFSFKKTNTAYILYCCISIFSSFLFMFSKRFCTIINSSTPSWELISAAVLCPALLFIICKIYNLCKLKRKNDL